MNQKRQKYIIHAPSGAPVRRGKRRNLKVKKRRLAGWGLGLIIFGGLAFSAMAWKSVDYYQHADGVYDHALLAKEKIELAQQAVVDQNFSLARAYVDEGIVEIEAAQLDLAGLNTLGKVPYLDTQLEAVDVLLESSLLAGLAMRRGVVVAETVLAPLDGKPGTTFDSISSAEKYQVLETLYNSRDDLRLIADKIIVAAEKLEDLPEDGVDQRILDAAEPLIEGLPEVADSVEEFLPWAEIIPYLAGYPEERDYLILQANSSELRSGFGFVGSYSTATVANAEVVDVFTDDIYVLDANVRDRFLRQPPYMFTRSGVVTEFFLRDVGIYPDFPAVAELALDLYDVETFRQNDFDGVVIVTPQMIEKVIEVVGTLEAQGVEFTAEEFLDTLQFESTTNFVSKGIPQERRKEIISELRDDLTNKIFNLPNDKWPTLFDVFQEGAKQKHFALYVTDEHQQELVTNAGWAAALPLDYPGDFLSWSDNNLGAWKTDKVMDRSLAYQLRVREDGRLAARAEMTFTNNAAGVDSTIEFVTRYNTYMKLYVPLGSEAVAVENGEDEPIDFGEELTYSLFGNWKDRIEPQTTESVAFEYILSDSVNQLITAKNFYQLYIPKQPGTNAHGLTLDLELPKKIAAATANYGDIRWSGNKLTLTGDLKYDVEVVVVFED